MSLIISSVVLFVAPLIWYTVEPAWSLVFTALLLGSAAIELFKLKSTAHFTRSSYALFGVAAFAVVSLLFNWLIIERGHPVYLDNMLHGTAFWLALSAVYFLSASDRSRVGIYVKLIAIAAGVAATAGRGLNDYLPHLRHGEAIWREFGNFTDPDFFAGQLVMGFPLALALFLGAKSEKGKTVWLLYVMAAVIIFGAIPTTGSRFALISTSIGIGSTIIAGLASIRSGMPFPKSSWKRLIALGVSVLLLVPLVAMPMTSRLSTGTMKTQAHSGNFRAWTWKGTIKLIESDPILGAGPAQFVYSYPKRAITGFTTHAHCAYLQTAADIGIPALVLLIWAFCCSWLNCFKSLSIRDSPAPEPTAPSNKKVRAPVPQENKESNFLAEISLIDDRYLIIGILGSIAAAMVQNLIDSDWFNFESGITLFALAGILTALSTKREISAPSRLLTFTFASLYAVLSIAALIFAVAEFQEQSGSYVAASQTDPLNGKYLGVAARYVYIPAGDFTETEKALIGACRLTPDTVSYNRLGAFYAQTNDKISALKAFNAGLAYDPKSLQLLMAAAEIKQSLNDTSGALGYYLQVAALEVSPFGTVRAIPEVSETRFPIADSSIADIFMARKRPSMAITYYVQSAADCEEYSSEGGASSQMRMAMNKLSYDKALDDQMRAIYVGALNNLAAAYTETGNYGAAKNVKTHFTSNLERFDNGLQKYKTKEQ